MPRKKTPTKEAVMDHLEEMVHYAGFAVSDYPREIAVPAEKAVEAAKQCLRDCGRKVD